MATKDPSRQPSRQHKPKIFLDADIEVDHACMDSLDGSSQHINPLSPSGHDQLRSRGACPSNVHRVDSGFDSVKKSDRYDSQFKSHDSGYRCSVNSHVVSEYRPNCESINSIGSLELSKLNLEDPASGCIQLKERTLDNKPSNSDNKYSVDEGFHSSSLSEEKNIQLQLRTDTRHASLQVSLPSIEFELFCQNDDGDTLLHLSIIDGDTDLCIQILLQVRQHSLINTPNNVLQTPLHLAVIHRDASLVRLLLAHGATVDARDRHGNTALHLACDRGFEHCVRALTRPLDHNDVKSVPYVVPFQRIPQNQNLLNYDGKSCLHLAAEANNYSIMSHLISNCDADINIKEGKAGESILHQTVQNTAYAELVSRIVSNHRCDINSRRYDGLTPLQLATGFNNQSAVEVLVRHGAQVNCSEDVEEEMELSEEPALIISPRKVATHRHLLPKTPPRDEDCMYDDIKIGGELVG